MKGTLKSSPYTSSIKYLKKSLLSKRDINDLSQLRMMESSFNHVKPKQINMQREKGLGLLGKVKPKTNISVGDHNYSRLQFGKKNPHFKDQEVKDNFMNKNKNTSMISLTTDRKDGKKITFNDLD